MIIIAGYVRAPAAVRTELEALVRDYALTCRKEPGCLAYDASFDVLEPEWLRMFEVYEDEAAFAAHDSAPHVQAWREARIALGVTERRLVRYEAASARPF